ncbi:MAG: PilN domain-containing protein [Deltaproteobacteria bacterium]|nr:PilN domain-containing protein [Deltaproteobacteria bacterium]
MIRINLLPVRQTRKLESLRREMALAGVLGAAVLGGCLFVWGLLEIRATSVKRENEKLDAEIAKLAEDVKRVDEMERYKAELQRKLEVIASLRAKKSGPAHMLEELALAAPEKLQLTGVVESGGAVTIEGAAVSNEIISQFLRALEASDYFEAVYLQNIEASTDKSAKKQTAGSIVVKAFALTARLVNPELKKVTEAAPPPDSKAPEVPEKGGKADAKAATGAGGGTQ